MWCKRKLKNIKKRESFDKYECKQILYKTLMKQTNLLNKEVQYNLFFDSSMPKISYKTRIKNYCVHSRRARSVFKKFRVSRLRIRVLGDQGIFFGLKRSSW